MVGVFINTLPICVDVEPSQALLPWLSQLQTQLVEMRQYEYTPLTEVQGWSNVPRGTTLFESIVVFENYPSPEVSDSDDADLTSDDFSAFYKTNYPLNVIGHPGPQLSLGINYDCRRFEAATITGILQHLELMLHAMVAQPNIQLRELQLLTAAQKQLAQTLSIAMPFNFDLALCE